MMNEVCVCSVYEKPMKTQWGPKPLCMVGAL